MLTKKLTECPRCGSTENLVNHHTSYLPEVIEFVCRKCDAKEKRNPKYRGFKVLKGYPSRSLLNFPKALLERFGDLIEIKTAPVAPVGVIFQYDLPLEYVEQALELVLRDLQLQIEHQQDEQPDVSEKSD